MSRWLFFAALMLPAAANAAAPPPILRDADGDPLPPGARLRLGTTRFRTLPVSLHGQTLVYSPDRTLMLLAAPAGSVRLCESLTGKPIQDFAAPGTWHFPGAVSPDGRLVATIGRDCRARIWEVATGRIRLDVFAGDNIRGLSSGPLLRVAFVRGGETFATWDERGMLIVRDLATGKVVRGARFAVKGYSAAFSPDGTRLVVRTSPHTMRIEDVRGGRPIVFSVTPSRQVHCAWSADGNTIAVTPFGAGPVMLYDIKTRQVRSCPLGERLAYRSAFSPDGQTLAVEDADRIHLFDTGTSKLLRTLAATHARLLGALHFVNNNRLHVVADHRIRAWDVRTAKALPQPDGPAAPLRVMAFGDGGRVLSGAGGDEFLHIYDARSGARTGRVTITGPKLHYDPTVRAVGHTVVYAPARTDPLTIIDTRASRSLGTIRPPFRQPFGGGALGGALGGGGLGGAFGGGAIGGGAFGGGGLGGAFGLTGMSFTNAEPFALSRDGRRLAVRVPVPQISSRLGPSIDVYSLGTQKLERQLDNAQGGSVAFLPDGDFLVRAFVENADLTVELIEVRTGQVRFTGRFNDVETGTVTRVLVSRDGGLIVALGAHHASLIERFTLSLIRRVSLPKGFAWNEAALTDDRRILLAGTTLPTTGALVEVGTKVTLRSLGYLSYRNDWSGLALCGATRTLAVAQEDTSILLFDIPDPKRARSPPPDARRLDALWTDLASEDAGRADAARQTLTDHAALAVALCRQRLEPTGSQLPAQRLEDLDDEDFRVRDAASKALAEQLARGNRAAEMELRALLRTRPSLEVSHRVERLLKPFAHTTPPPTAEERRATRAVGVLEQIASADAIALLKRLAGGGVSVLTQESCSALARLRSR